MELQKEAGKLIGDFNQIVNIIEWTPTKEYKEMLNSLVFNLNKYLISNENKRTSNLIKLINEKFNLNNATFKNIIDSCAKYKVYFNYHEKAKVLSYLNTNHFDKFKEFILKNIDCEEVGLEILNLFDAIDSGETINTLMGILEEKPTQKDKILHSLFSGFVFNSFDKKAIHSYFSGLSVNSNYNEQYYDFLNINYPEFFKRDCSLIYVTLDQGKFDEYNSHDSFLNDLFELIENSYHKINNHGHLALQIKPIKKENVNIQWDIYSDVVLFAEKFKETYVSKQYFKPKKIEQETKDYISELDIEDANFIIANEGFTYKDNLILSSHLVDSTNYSPYDMLILFEKNERDERKVPCPACRGTMVQGNSYPKLNIRSWECKNIFCPGKSKYNRGKRYSLSSIIKQNAIEQEGNLIPKEHIQKWRLDIRNINDDLEVLEFLVRHYTLYDDTIHVINFKGEAPKNFIGRNIKVRKLDIDNPSHNHVQKFFSSSFFKRFLIDKINEKDNQTTDYSQGEHFKVICDDAFSALKKIDSNSIDGAVTSPPYYNAKDYSNWDNIYNYLYDMYNISKEVYRVLKEGQVYLFNIFDYFDNENNIVSSDMGTKRMILGAYMLHIFKKVGFNINSNIIWNKGEIEGKRNFNQGNLSPFYQAPHNAWEHILVLSKGVISEDLNFPSILRAKPVFKMKNKQNTLGHTAPFPKIIPELLIDNLRPGETILDPFAGSFTTGRAAYAKGINSINIDYQEEYCELGMKLFEKEFGMEANVNLYQEKTSI